MTDIPEGCQPFDLEKAKAGAKVITQCGRQVTQITEFDGVGKFCIRAVVDGEIVSFTRDGKASEWNPSLFVLVMAPPPMKEVTLYVVAAEFSRPGFYGWVYTSMEAVACEQPDTDVNKIHPITIKVPV